MYIQKIKISNFKSIYDPLELDFNDIKGFWKISGSVGAGKTTIGEAVIFGLFGSINGKNNNDLISWGQKHSLIEIWCSSKNKNIYIKREINLYGQSPMRVEVDGEEIIFTNKRDAQQQLEKEYYDISRVTVELLCIISFNNFKSLATLNTQDTKKFLDQVLGFYTLTQYSGICKSFENENINKINDIKSQISHKLSQISKLEEIANKDIINGNIDEIKEDINNIEKDINDLNSKYSKIINDLQNQKLIKSQELASLTILGKNKAKEISLIEKGTCPTCGAPIDQSQLDIKKAEKVALLNQYNVINSDITRISSQISTETEKMNKSISSMQTRVISQKNMLIRLEEQERKLNINIDEIESIKKAIEELKNNLTLLMHEDTEWKQLYNMLAIEIRAKILSSFIPILNKNILKYTQRLQQPYIVQFDSNFKCMISICGYENQIPITSLSTGQLKMIDMIIILGVLGTIIGSSSTNIMFLDELFSNLDVDLRNKMCQVLKESTDPNNTLFIISHQDLDEHYFDGYINMRLEQCNQYEKKSITKIKKLH